jgi:zinc transporter
MQRLSEDGLICAYRLDGKGGGEPLDWDGVRAQRAGSGLLWLHLDYKQEDSRAWLDHESGIDEVVRGALLADEPRPRALVHAQGLMLIVRAININAGAQPEEMVSMRIWLDSQRVITLRHRFNQPAKAMRRLVAEGRGPRRVGQFVVMLLDCILDGVGEVSDRLDGDVARLEQQVAESDRDELRHAIADARRRAIGLKRHLAPQRDVFSRLESERVTWLNEVDRAQLREEANRLTRILEDLEAARDRAAVTQEEVASRLSEATNRRLYVLSIVAAIFLPLGLVTGLLGVNVGGIPLRDHPQGFLVVSGMMAVLLGLQLVVFRILRWL